MSFLGSIFHHSKGATTAIGIDIGTTSIKLVELNKSGSTITLSNYAFVELSDKSNSLNNALQSSSLHPLTADLTSFLKVIHHKLQLHSTEVALSLPTFIAQTALLDVPKGNGSEKSIAGSVLKTAGAYLPLPLAETTMDWSEIGDVTMPDGSVHKKILFIAIPTERVNDYKLIAENSGFKVINTELESISTARALTLNSQEPTLIIDMGGRSSTCTVAKNGKAYAITQTDFSSDSATQAVSQALSISPKRAEALKRQSAVHLDAGTHELSTIVTPIIGAILTEAERAQKTFEEATGEKIAKVVLCGAGSQLSGIEKYAETQLKLPVTRAGAIGTLISYPPELLAILPELNAHLTVAIGLALKKLI